MGMNAGWSSCIWDFRLTDWKDYDNIAVHTKQGFTKKLMRREAMLFWMVLQMMR
jgi:hypothetical protein